MSVPIARVQGKAPHWSGTAVINGEFEQISLDKYAGEYLVLFFYPNDFTFVCPTEIIAFSNRLTEFRKMKCNVVGCSCDSQYVHLAWTEAPTSKGGVGALEIPLLADVTKKISKDYGVLLEDQGISLRGLFIIDNKGIIRHISINDVQVGRSVDEVLRLVRAFQYTDVHGEVCPEGWKPQQPAIAPRMNSTSASLKS